MCFPKESDFLKNTLLWNEQSNLQDKRNDGEQLKDRKKKKKKSFCGHCTYLTLQNSSWKHSSMLLLAQAVQLHWNVPQNHKVTQKWIKLAHLYMTYVDWIIPEISFHYLNFFFLSIKIRCVDLYESDATEGIKNQHLHRYLTNTLIRSNNSSILPFVKFRPCLHS